MKASSTRAFAPAAVGSLLTRSQRRTCQAGTRACARVSTVRFPPGSISSMTGSPSVHVRRSTSASRGSNFFIVMETIVARGGDR
jgi:hypothetical protein